MKEDITRIASWQPGAVVSRLNIDLVSVSADYWPDFSAKVVFFAEGQTTRDERGYSKCSGYDIILESDYIYGTSEDDCKSRVREWINLNAPIALEKILNRAKVCAASMKE